jgi:glycosyltransferase involved in cell wall biosynthesis
MNYSIILPTLNENGHIIDLINSIIKNFTNTKNNYEIIVVDDNSNDGTISTIKKYIIKNKKIRLFIRKNKKKNLFLGPPNFDGYQGNPEFEGFKVII